MRTPAFSISLPTQTAPRLERPIQGLLLDNCDTLYDATGWRRWLLQVLRRLGLHTNYRCFFHVWDEDYLDAVHRGERDLCDAFRAFLQAIGLSRGQVDEVATACETRRKRWESEARPLPGVKKTLQRLAAAGVPMAVVSDSEQTAAELRRHLEGMGLRGLFAAVVTSRDLGQTKPEAVCYEAALDVLRLHAGQVAFVGHDTKELSGAAQLGMQTIGFNCWPETEADLVLSRFNELAELIDLRAERSAAG